MIYIVGVGGGGGWLAQACYKQGLLDVVLIDGDRVEANNTARQLFAESDVGEFKAKVLAERYGYESANFYLTSSYNFDEGSIVFVCVDNDVARKDILTIADRCRVKAVFIASNETRDAQAVMYLPRWKDTEHDYRNIFPEVLTNTEGSPFHRCTAPEVLTRAPQTAVVNMLSAAAVLTMYYEFLELRDYPESMPVMINMYGATYKTYRIGQLP